jgi:hypothetical protein
MFVINNILDDIISVLDIVEDYEDIAVETIHNETEKTEQSNSDL